MHHVVCQQLVSILFSTLIPLVFLKRNLSSFHFNSLFTCTYMQSKDISLSLSLRCTVRFLLYSTDGQVPSVLFPKHTELGRMDEFNVSCFEAIRLLSECWIHVLYMQLYLLHGVSIWQCKVCHAVLQDRIWGKGLNEPPTCTPPGKGSGCTVGQLAFGW